MGWYGRTGSLMLVTGILVHGIVLAVRMLIGCVALMVLLGIQELKPLTTIKKTKIPD